MLLLQRQSNDARAASYVSSSSTSSVSACAAAATNSTPAPSPTATPSYAGPRGYARVRAEAASSVVGRRHHRRQKDGECLFMRMVDDRPYFPLYAVDPADEISMIDIVDSILLASSSSSARYGIDVCGRRDGNNSNSNGGGGGGAGMSNIDGVTITPIAGGLTNALYKVDYPSIQQHQHRQRQCECKKGGIVSSSVLVRIFGAEGIIDRDVETNTFARLCGTTTTTTTTTGGSGADGTNDKLVHPALDILGRFANGRVETYIPNMRPATVHNDLVGATVDVEKSSASAAMKKKKKKKEEEEEEEVKEVEQSPQLLLGLEVARQMARLHYGMTTTQHSSLEQPSTQPTLWKVINSWIHDLATKITNEKIQRFHRRVLHNIITGQDDYSSPTEEEEEDDDDHYYNNGHLVSYLYNEVIWLQRYVERNFSTANCPVTLCHNDINPGNILLLVDDTTTTSSATTTTTTTTTATIAPPVFNRETVCIIDYEYCDTNYSMYDVANYICEYAGGNDNGIPNYDLLPSNDYQISFLCEYIRTRNELTNTTTTTHDGGMSGDDDDDYYEEVAQLLEQVEVFQMASCLLWGVWGILQSTTQIIDDSETTFTFDENLQSRLNGEADVDIFDYLRYGKNRLARYRYLKQQTTSID